MVIIVGMRRLLTLLLLLPWATPAAASSFSDVPGGHWASEAVESLARVGILQGMPDGTYRGASPATRYELALALYRLYLLFHARLEELQKGNLQAGKELKALLEVAPQAIPEGEGLRPLLAELAARVTALESGLAEATGRTLELRTLSEAQAALEGLQNAKLVELEAQLETLRHLLRDMVSRKEFKAAYDQTAETLSGLVKEVARLREELEKVQAAATKAEAFAEARKGDLSLREMKGEGRVETAPYPLPQTEPQGSRLTFGLSKGGTKAEVEVGFLSSYPVLGLKVGEEKTVGARVTPGGFRLEYREGDLEGRFWSASGHAAFRANLLGEEARFSVAGGTGAFPSPVGEILEAPILTAAGVQAQLELGRGPLKAFAEGVAMEGGQFWGLAGLRLEASPLTLQAGYAGAVAGGQGTREIPPLQPGTRLTEGVRAEARLGTETASFGVRYASLPEAPYTGVLLEVRDASLKGSLEAGYAWGTWYKVKGAVEGRLGSLEGRARFGLSQSTSLAQAFSDLTFLLAVRPDLRLGVGYGDLVSLGMLHGPYMEAPSPLFPALFLGAPPGLVRWGSALVEYGGFLVRYDLILGGTRPADRFGLSYAFSLP